MLTITVWGYSEMTDDDLELSVVMCISATDESDCTV